MARITLTRLLIPIALLVVLSLVSGCATTQSTPASAPSAPASASTSASAAAAPSPSSAPDPATPAASQAIAIVAVENFYGEMAQQIGGGHVQVESILRDPNLDPHEYEPTVADAKAIADAQLVIMNGLGYDAFVDNLIAAAPRPSRLVIDVGQLTGHADGDNPHIWYDPATMPRAAEELASTLTKLDPAHADEYDANLKSFLDSERAVDDSITAIKAKYEGAKVLATEPVFSYMADATGLEVVDQNGDFQRAVEEGNDPPASAVARYQDLLTTHAVKALILNVQAVTPITTQLRELAIKENVPVVEVTETQPEGKTYRQWMLDELQSLRQALGG